MDPDIGKSMDRISNLPDALLCHILSFLSTKYAVGTSILSTRWQYLWTFVPNLDFDESQLFHEYSLLSEDRRKQVDVMFVYFVSRVLMRFNDAPYLRKFILRIDSLDVPDLDLDFDLVDTWISAAIIRNVQDLELHNLIENNVMLPDCLFTSKTLVTLTLCEVFLDVPDLVRFPNLKILNLDSVEYEDEDSLQKLFSGCPVLEQLNLERCILDKQQVVSVSVSTLKRLKVVWYREYFVLDESDDLVYKLVVDAPQLERFYLRDNVSNEFLFRNLSSLSEASFCVGPPFYGSNTNSDDAFHLYKLLSGTSNVKLLDAYLSAIQYSCRPMPTFHKLTKLKLGTMNPSGWQLLPHLLERSPNIQILVFMEGATKYLRDVCQHLFLFVYHCTFRKSRSRDSMGRKMNSS
ncbi:hypothetical protein CsSME_00026230 [Camellia sinensis var. sinensis]